MRLKDLIAALKLMQTRHGDREVLVCDGIRYLEVDGNEPCNLDDVDEIDSAVVINVVYDR